MGKKYIKCPRCELNYILEGEDYCPVCKSEMKHHAEDDDDELLDFDELELCPVCGVNYIKPEQAMCEDCKKKKNESGDGEEPVETAWKKSDDDDDDSLISASDDIDGDDEDEDDYNPGFEDVTEEDDPYADEVKSSLIEDDLDEPIAFGSDDEEDEDLDETVEEVQDDFETVEVSDDDDDDEDEDDDDYDFGGDDDLLGVKK